MDSDNLFYVTSSSSGKAAHRSGLGSLGFGAGGSGAPTPATLPRTGAADADAAHRFGWTNPAPRGNTSATALSFPDGFQAQLDLGPLTIPVSNPNPNHSTSERSDEGLQCDAWMY
jgi:hypothetical protein